MVASNWLTRLPLACAPPPNPRDLETERHKRFIFVPLQPTRTRVSLHVLGLRVWATATFAKTTSQSQGNCDVVVNVGTDEQRH